MSHNVAYCFSTVLPQQHLSAREKIWCTLQLRIPFVVVFLHWLRSRVNSRKKKSFDLHKNAAGILCAQWEWEKQFIEEASSMYTFLLVGTFFLSLLAAADFGNPIFYAQQDTYILSIQCCVWAVTYWKHRLCFARETNYTFNFLIQLLHDCCQWFSKNAAAAMSRQACEWVKQSMPFFFHTLCRNVWQGRSPPHHA